MNGVLTAIIIIVIMLALIGLIGYICTTRKRMTEINSINGLVGGSIQIPKFPEVSVLTAQVLVHHALSEFVWLEKTDGERCPLVFTDGKMHELRRGELTEIQDVDNVKDTVLDSELYEGRYLVFDAAIVDGKDVSDKPFVKRMEAAGKWISNHSSLPLMLKEYHEVTTLQDLWNFINNEHSMYTNNRIDGAVLQLKHAPFSNAGEPIAYKLKRPVLTTTDFLLKLNSNVYGNRSNSGPVYSLYLSATSDDFLYNRKWLPKVNKLSKEQVGVDLKNSKSLSKVFPLLFASPYTEGLHQFTPSAHLDDTRYFPGEIQSITELAQQMINDPKAFDSKIVELSLSKNGWVPLRVREDKRFPNAYRVGLSNCGVIFSPLITTGTYFSKKLKSKSDLIAAYHASSQSIRAFVVEKTINTLYNKLRRKLDVVDLCCGRGGDIVNLYHAGARNIFAVDGDKEALVRYCDKAHHIHSVEHKFLLPETKEPTGLPKSAFVNIVHGILEDDNEHIVRNIRKRFECPKDGFDVIIMNFAIHYLCDSEAKMSALSRMVGKLLRPSGIFVFTYFDGDRIIDDMGKSNSLSVGPYVIKKKSNGVYQMPMPTIDEKGYREEPLATNEYLDIINMSVNDEFCPADFPEVRIDSTCYDYMKYITVRIMGS